MAEFGKLVMDITQGFVSGIGDFWNWFINPIITIGDLTIAPYMIISFTAFMVIFALVLVHLINPLG